MNSINAGDQSRRSGAVRTVLRSELLAEQPLFGANARDDHGNQEHREQHADARTKCKGPTERVDEQPECIGMADDAVDAVGTSVCPGWMPPAR